MFEATGRADVRVQAFFDEVKMDSFIQNNFYHDISLHLARSTGRMLNFIFLNSVNLTKNRSISGDASLDIPKVADKVVRKDRRVCKSGPSVVLGGNVVESLILPVPLMEVGGLEVPIPSLGILVGLEEPVCKSRIVRKIGGRKGVGRPVAPHSSASFLTDCLFLHVKIFSRLQSVY